MKNMTLIGVGASIIAISLMGCSSTPKIMDDSGANLLERGNTVKTLANLHPDPNKAKLYAVNYQQSGLIPVCSEVTIDDVSGKRLIFTLKSDSRRYSYDYHKAAVDSFDKHLALYFGADCNQAEIDTLSDTDKQGIEKGTAMVGMSKKGVVYAMGYPPQHRTPSLTATEWRYWKNRFATLVIQFDNDGIVTHIQQ